MAISETTSRTSINPPRAGAAIAAPVFASAIAALMCIFVVVGCDALVRTNPPLDDAAVSFSRQVQPILTTNCAGCHRRGGIADERGISLWLGVGLSYDLLIDQPSMQDVGLTLVSAGDADGSLLFLKVSSDTPPVGERMPRYAPNLTDAEIALIRNWINQGALDN